MRKQLIVGLMALMVAGVCAIPLPQVKAATPDMTAAQKTVEDFAPWISAIILQKTAIAAAIFPLQRPAMEEVTSAASLEVYTRFSKLDEVTISLIGEHVLGDHIETLLFTAATEDGPVAFKVSVYRFGTETRIGKVQIVDHWSELEALSQTVELLPSPVTATLQSKPH